MKLERFKVRIGIFLLLSLLLSSVLYSHKPHYPKVLIVEMLDNSVKVMLNYIVPSGDESLNLRKKFDFDRDGVLSQAEQDELQREVLRSLLLTLVVSLNGKKLTFEPLDYRANNVGPLVDSSMEIPIDVYLIAPEQKFQKSNEIRVSDFLLNSTVPVPLIVKLNPAFVIKSSSKGKIIHKSNIVQNIYLKMGDAVLINFEKR